MNFYNLQLPNISFATYSNDILSFYFEQFQGLGWVKNTPNGLNMKLRIFFLAINCKK